MLSLFPLGYALLVKIKEFFAQNYDDEEACYFYLPMHSSQKNLEVSSVYGGPK